MTRIDGGELLVRCLEAEGVQVMFAIPDVSYTPVMRSAEEHGVRVLGGRHESANVHMAEGWARATGGVGVTLAAMGPGVANMVPGVFTAWIEGVPLLAIGTQRTDRAHRSIRRGRFQHAPQLDAFRPITKFAAVVPDAPRIPEYIREALRHALLGGRPGPVYLEFPVDVLREQVEAGELRMPASRSYSLAPSVPDAGATNRAAELIDGAQLAIVIAGQGVARAGAESQLRQLVERAGALLMTSPSARGLLPEDDRHVIGTPLLSPGGAQAARQADVVLAVGTEVGEMLGYGRPPRWGDYETQRWIQLDLDPTSIGVNREVEVGLVGDAAAGLVALNEALVARGTNRDLPAEAIECVTLERELMAQVAETLGQAGGAPVHPGRLAKEVADFFPEDAIACFDGGNTALWAFLMHRFQTPRSMLWTGHFGHLGTGLPYAIAAALAHPERCVYLVTGDSALGFNLAELETAAREGANIVIVVACDYAWAMEALGQQKEVGRTLNVETSRVRYDQVARALGCHGELVERTEDVRPALERALAAAGPALVHVEINAEDNVSPPFLEAFLEMYEARDT